MDVRKLRDDCGSRREDRIVVSIWMRINMGWRRIAPNMGCFRNASDFSVTRGLVGPRKAIELIKEGMCIQAFQHCSIPLNI